MKFNGIVDRVKVSLRKAIGKFMRKLLRYTGYEFDTMEQRIRHLQQLEHSLLSERQQREDLSLRLADSIRHLALLACKSEIASTASLLKISVILPLYNRAHMVQAAIQSVLEEHDVILELLIIDDGSTDEPRAAIGPLLSHPAVRYLPLSHGGVCVARNHGLASSTGDIIVYLDSDNTIYPDYLRNIAIAYANAPEAECAFAAMLWDDGRSGVHLRHDRFDWKELLAGKINLDINCFSHRRLLFEKLGGFDESLTQYEDYDLVLRYTKEHEPLRLRAIAAHYNHSYLYSRISNTQPSAPNIARIRSKHGTAQ